MNVIEEHPQALHLLESFILAATSDDSTMLDLHVLDALEAARRTFSSRLTGRSFTGPKMDERASAILLGITAAGWVLLGESNPDVEIDPTAGAPKTISLEILIECIKRIEKSVKLWNGQGGRRGYIEYISEFLP